MNLDFLKALDLSPNQKSKLKADSLLSVQETFTALYKKCLLPQEILDQGCSVKADPDSGAPSWLKVRSQNGNVSV